MKTNIEKRLNFALIISLMLFFSNCSNEKEQPFSVQEYTWKNVQIVGGGFVDGFVFHPMEKDLVYARTDMGGAYRRDKENKNWVPLNDWISYKDRNLMGIESIALDPNNPDKLYMSCGTYTNEKMPNGEILISNDRGNTFQRIKVPFKMGGNENGRGNGERMAVDPNNGAVLYLGTRHSGLWKSTDSAKTWSRVESFPDVIESVPDSITDERYKRYWRWAYKGSGINVVFCDHNSGKPGEGSNIVYVFVSLSGRDNFFKSNDAGKTWEPVPKHPQNLKPNHAVIASNGMIYVSYGDTPGPSEMKDGAIWSYDTKSGKWRDITPEKPWPGEKHSMGYASVAVDPQNPKVIVACTFHRSGQLGGDEIFRSTDGGESWQGVFANGATYDFSKAPYTARTGIHWLFDFEINPFNPDHAIFTTGYGGHETFNLTDLDKKKPVVWEIMSTGIEETVPLDLLSPPKGPHLITGIGDYGGFIHWDLDKPAPEGNYINPHFGNTDGLAIAKNNPDMIVRVGVASHQRPTDTNIGLSTDMGKTWQPVNAPTKESKHGHIAVSADGKSWIWTPEHQKPYLTTDTGNTWEELTQLPENMKIVADKVNPLRFYGVNIEKHVYYYSIDGGNTFTTVNTGIGPKKTDEQGDRGDRRGGQDRIYATPGIENELWIAAFDGLFYKPTSDTAFVQMSHVEEIHAFGFGKAAPGIAYPTLFLIGTISGQRGIFRSDDKATSWVKINDDEHQWGLLLLITGDPKKYGRVYVGTHGRGAIYGDPVE